MGEERRGQEEEEKRDSSCCTPLARPGTTGQAVRMGREATREEEVWLPADFCFHLLFFIYIFVLFLFLFLFLYITYLFIYP
jgi:hypothetical protein